jgi:hypothetical protein
MSWASTLYWLALCGFAGAIVHSEFLDRDTSDDALGDAPHGDWVTLPTDFELFHETQPSGGAPHDN